MVHVTIDHSSAAWAVNNPVIRGCISRLCGLVVIIMPAWCKARCPTTAACDCWQARWLNIWWKLCWLTSVLLLSGLSHSLCLRSVLLSFSFLYFLLLNSSLLLSSFPPLSILPCILLASLSSLLITPFPSPGSSLTSSCASSYQRRWLRSITTSLENGVFPRWWDACDHMSTHSCATYTFKHILHQIHL